MDTTNSNIYVAELLQQLEELKRKKARRLQKLKKLKKPSSCHQGNMVNDISFRSIENISRHSGEQQSNPVSECVKCGLCLISKDSPCIQCISAASKENKGQRDSEKRSIALKVETDNSENQTISYPEVSENGNDIKSAFKHKHTEQSLPLSVINEVQNGDSPCNVLEPVQNKIITNFKEKLSSSSEQSRKQRKRSTTVEDDLDQGEQYDHKKLKLSGESLPKTNISNNSSSVGDSLNGNSEVSSVDKPNETEEQRIRHPKVLMTADVVDDSLLHNMSCFLSSSLLAEDEDNSKVGIGHPTEQFTMATRLTESAIDLKLNVCDLKSTENEMKDILNSSISKKANGNKFIESLKPGYCSEQVNFNNSALVESLEKCEALSRNDNCVLSTTKSDIFNGDTVNTPEVIPDTCTSVQNLESIHSKDFNNSGQNRTLGNKLLSEPDVHCESPTEKFTSSPEKISDITKGYENTSNCLSDASHFNLKDQTIEADEDMSEGLSSDSQLIKGLKASDFSSFENSNSIEKAQLVIEVEPENIENNQTLSLIDATYTSSLKIINIKDNSLFSQSQVIPHAKQKELGNNETPSLLDSCDRMIPYHEDGNASDEDDLNCIPETSALKCDRVAQQIDESEHLFDVDDALTADIDFECTSLEVADTLDDLVTKSIKNHDGSVLYCEKPINVASEYTSINVLELNAPDAEVFTIPETVLFETAHSNESKMHVDQDKDAFEESKTQSRIKCSEYQVPFNKDVPVEIAEKSTRYASVHNAYVACGIFEETQCDSLDQLQTIQDTVFLDTEDSLALGNYKNIPFIENEVKKTSSSDLEEIPEDQETIMKFLCCLQSDIDEPVNDVKLVTFNSTFYAFIQHVTWIQVWRQEESRDWIKIFSHQVDDKLKLKEICFTKDAKHLVLIMLLCGDQVHCLQFLLFESEARVIKLMEHTHWMQNRWPEETVLLCGLGDLKFATVQGKECFEVFVHIFSCLQDNPRLAMVTLGSTAGPLHSLCKIEKLPNALLGTSYSTLYVWHLLEARLVTCVSLQLPDQLTIEKCIWATIESGLVFFMTICEDKDHFRSCQLLATNLATGFCQTAMSYSFLPSKQIQNMKNRNLKAVYNEPFLAVSCEDGCFLWSVSDEYCCAALGAKADVTAINIGSDREDKLLVAVGNAEGCVNCFSLKCS